MLGLSKQQIFNQWAPSYDCLWTTVFYQAIHQRLLEYVELPDRPQVLDLGCGTGLDFSASMLQVAQSRNRYNTRLTFVAGDAISLPFEAAQFDAAFSTISFLHYPDPRAVCAEIARVLRSQGRFYLADYTLPRCQHGSRKLPISPDGLTLYSQEARARLGEEVGLICAGHYYLLGLVLLTVFVRS